MPSAANTDVLCVCVHVCVCVCVCAHVEVMVSECLLQCLLGLSLSPPLPLKAHVEAAKLLQEAGVGADVSVLSDGSRRLLQPQAFDDHEEGQNQGCGAAHAHQTVNKHPSWDRDVTFSIRNAANVNTQIVSNNSFSTLDKQSKHQTGAQLWIIKRGTCINATQRVQTCLPWPVQL